MVVKIVSFVDRSIRRAGGSMEEPARPTQLTPADVRRHSAVELALSNLRPVDHGSAAHQTVRQTHPNHGKISVKVCSNC